MICSIYFDEDFRTDKEYEDYSHSLFKKYKEKLKNYMNMRYIDYIFTPYYNSITVDVKCNDRMDKLFKNDIFISYVKERTLFGIPKDDYKCKVELAIEFLYNIKNFDINK